MDHLSPEAKAVVADLITSYTGDPGFDIRSAVIQSPFVPNDYAESIVTYVKEEVTARIIPEVKESVKEKPPWLDKLKASRTQSNVAAQTVAPRTEPKIDPVKVEEVFDELQEAAEPDILLNPETAPPETEPIVAPKVAPVTVTKKEAKALKKKAKAKKRK